MNSNNDDAVIFLHLPKCGGTTLNRVIEWEYPALSVFSVDPAFFRWSYDRLTRWPAYRLAQMRVFKGHMPFGLHRLLPQKATYITVLREPSERAVSEYYYALSRVVHPEHRMMKRLTLEEYIRTTPYANVQTKLLAGGNLGYDFLAGPCEADTLDLAKENLARRFTLIGLTERLDECLALAKVLFGWEIRRYARFNVTRSRPNMDQVPLATRELIRERYCHDVELYGYAMGLFNEMLARHRQAVSKELKNIHESEALSPSESLYYRAASFTRKAICRVHSAV